VLLPWTHVAKPFLRSLESATLRPDMGSFVGEFSATGRDQLAPFQVDANGV
jgi:hypothetical protein